MWMWVGVALGAGGGEGLTSGLGVAALIARIGRHETTERSACLPACLSCLVLPGLFVWVKEVGKGSVHCNTVMLTWNHGGHFGDGCELLLVLCMCCWDWRRQDCWYAASGA